MNVGKTLVRIAALGAVPVIGALVAVTLGFKLYSIPQDGMYPTMPSGTHVIAKRSPYGDVSEVVRGDVVVWRLEQEGDQYNVVWRVLGVPGDSLRFTRSGVFLNGSALELRAVSQDGPLAQFREKLGDAEYDVAYERESARPEAQFRVPPGHLFLVGDNRDHAYDSRWAGPVPFEAIVGKVVWWSGG